LVLEGLKGNADAPFVTVDKGEMPPVYPGAFLNKINSNWEKVCDLMSWKKEGKPVDVNFFAVSKDPFAVVTLIQEKIVAEGGKLSRYGVDGKFGNETQNALANSLSKKTEAVPISTHVDVAQDLTTAALRSFDAMSGREPSVAGGVEKVNLADRLIREKIGEMIKAWPRIDARLKDADLNIDMEWLKTNDFSDADVVIFQTRAMQFREKLAKEDKKLEPLNRVMPKLISSIEEEIGKIDLKEINSMKDLNRALEELGKGISLKMDSMNDLFSDKELEDLIGDVDIEVLMSFFLASMHELTVLMAKYFKGNEQNFERIMKIFENEFLVHLKPKAVVAIGDAKDKKPASKLG